MPDILFLGTSAAVPSKTHATSCIAVRSGPDIILLDCGEGSQRQLMLSPFSFMKIRAILITHLHGDHIFGLPGLLQTMSLSNRTEPLTVIGPRGISGALDAMMSVTEGETQYRVDVAEADGGEVFDVNGMTVIPYPTDHGIPSLGFVVRDRSRPGRIDAEKARSLGITDGKEMAMLKAGQEVRGVKPSQVVSGPIPGYTIAYSGDTRPCGSETAAVAGADVLIHEATYLDAESEQAFEHYHTTALQAARIALEAGVGNLVLTHVSNRYSDRSVLLDEARPVFGNTYAADDMMLLELSSKGLRQKSD